MEHPLIANLDHLTEEQLSDRISELYKKLTIAQSTGNGHLCNQLRMAIESYKNKYQQKLSHKKSSDDFNDKINIQ